MHVLFLYRSHLTPLGDSYDSKAADSAIRGAARGLKVVHQLPRPQSQLFLQAAAQQELSDLLSLIESNL